MCMCICICIHIRINTHICVQAGQLVIGATTLTYGCRAAASGVACDKMRFGKKLALQVADDQSGALR